MFQLKRVKRAVGNKTKKITYADEELTYIVGNSTYSYKILADGTIEITGYEGTDREIVIPREIEGRRVTSIGDFVFF